MQRSCPHQGPPWELSLPFKKQLTSEYLIDMLKTRMVVIFLKFLGRAAFKYSISRRTPDCGWCLFHSNVCVGLRRGKNVAQPKYTDDNANTSVLSRSTVAGPYITCSYSALLRLAFNSVRLVKEQHDTFGASAGGHTQTSQP